MIERDREREEKEGSEAVLGKEVARENNTQEEKRDHESKVDSSAGPSASDGAADAAVPPPAMPTPPLAVSTLQQDILPAWCAY